METLCSLKKLKGTTRQLEQFSEKYPGIPELFIQMDLDSLSRLIEKMDRMPIMTEILEDEGSFVQKQLQLLRNDYPNLFKKR
ncbi:hypothetical protein A2130_04775 [Candidatus Woesebacteria bacterium GWC2_33_12]|uniref:Uncharacterized protein n=1 Tax=Candidatus Woesebacteria bacterium GW2011_GWB1_33_22 TaxID=1618566 RepID=A0A0F9ZLV5_9BACT|nr:MAG: hypothetical protein UR29_C0005G0052 [Candidatus Woesebacteria bacterium GW2011_GWC2_33_12]KKP42358.1 MAG: hypothetical protein UR33_C0003G0051 [Candidatus Woesebacteria bacterium GW2011_GWA2_33_20]KKP45109.1 MAG: hypothetical protein UR35_C0003G0051 [Candidatus Woesebacteria bacterium GW2011_GWB1_33_22]KKP46985.1 MAG: hypothetical protein UR37_C0003G0051 [Microgenomates group bacterium GW2011_GWC1_33_28]KKP50811.1 MAG: hypothetical protein UR41_C0003G0051 [Candidatus Woesebacteria bact